MCMRKSSIEDGVDPFDSVRDGETRNFFGDVLLSSLLCCGGSVFPRCELCRRELIVMVMVW